MPIANKSSAEKNTSTKRSTKKITTSVGVVKHIHKSVDLSNINIDKQIEKETVEKKLHPPRVRQTFIVTFIKLRFL